MSERVAIVGSREHPNLELVREYVRGLPDDVVIVSGGAAGVDVTAYNEAKSRDLKTVNVFPLDGGIQIEQFPRYKHFTFGKQSPRDLLIFRNTMIAMFCTRMVAFVDGSKGGTWDAIKQAERFRRPVEIVRAK